MYQKVNELSMVMAAKWFSFKLAISPKGKARKGQGLIEYLAILAVVAGIVYLFKDKFSSGVIDPLITTVKTKISQLAN